MFVLLLFASLAATAQQTTVQVKVKGLKAENPEAVVEYVEGNKLMPYDTLGIASGKFSFTVAIARPTLYLIHFSGTGQSMLHVMLEPGDKVKLDVAFDAEADYLNVVSATGSRNVELYAQFNSILYGTAVQAKKIESEYVQSGTSEQRKQELGQQMQQVQLSQSIAVRNLIEKNTDVLFSAFLVTFFDRDFETYAELFEAVDNGLKDRYADDQFVRYIDSRVKTNLGPGRMAPEIEMTDPNGNTRKLSSLRGNVVLLDFWASWCRPCRMENPNVVALYKKYNAKGFEIYSVSLDRTRADWVRAIEQDGLVWPNHVSDLNGWTSSGGAAYGIKSVPSTVLIDRQGRIIARNLRGDQLANKLKEIFSE